MPRPRVHDPDRVLDAVESLAAASGPAAVTIRAIGAAVGMSNGALYHSYGSRAGLAGAAWLRAGRRFLGLQQDLVEDALSDRGPADAVVAAADAPVVFAGRHPESAKLLLTIRRDDLLGEDLPTDIAAQLAELDTSLVALMSQLAAAVWDRKDADAVDTITTCIVDLPTAIVLGRERLGSPTARDHLHAAVRAVLAVGPPPPKGQTA
ncbi:TetR/AcrR family transcriptional regulator [Mycobacterium sp. pUA109]|uniref:TetR/AcrR family transcriptional regulator n=1 Tax=Mycobacterium sp. pUA109 TaxID=3238982 RepID=UPI00351B0170